MPDNFHDPIDREANYVNCFLASGDRASASARLQQDLASMGPSQFMALIGETKGLAEATHSRTHLEITPLNLPGDPCPTPAKVDVSLATPTVDRWGQPTVIRDEVAQIDNREQYAPAPPVVIEPPPPPPPVPSPIIIAPRPRPLINLNIDINHRH